ncbi:MAG TPA: DUF308 domain-containing protein [Opitutaceae bacterium]
MPETGSRREDEHPVEPGGALEALLIERRPPAEGGVSVPASHRDRDQSGVAGSSPCPEYAVQSIPMKTCTLIVRLVGIYLFLSGLTSLVGIIGMAANRGSGMRLSVFAYVSISAYIAAGLALTLKAPLAARLLTRDEPEE